MIMSDAELEAILLPERHTGLEMTKTFAFGADSAAALARSRTIDALVLNKSGEKISTVQRHVELGLDYRHESCLAFEEHRPG